jgi:hypothetical protein
MSRALAIDFAPRRRAGSWLGACILLAGLIAAVGVGEHYRALERSREALEAQLHSSARARPAMQRAGDAATQAALERRSQARQAVVRALGRPWDRLFGDIEAAPAEDIALLAIEPDPRRAEVRIAGEARDAAALHRYVAALETTPSLDRVGLLQHEALGEGALRFVVIGRWQDVAR